MRKLNLGISLFLIGGLVPGNGWADSFSREKERPGKAASVETVGVQIPLPNPWQQKEDWNPKLALPEKLVAAGAEEERQLRLQGIYNWLCGQQNRLTGLVESFEGSADPFLKDQAATYDQALAGMAFLLLGDAARAKQILDFYASRWEGKGFYNFYSTVNGRVGLEWRRHVGPNMWLALLAFQYAHLTGDKSFLPMGEGLCDWVVSLPHYNGGPAMSDQNELEIPWREIVSTENVIDALALFQMAAPRAIDFRKKQELLQELSEFKRFFKSTAFNPDGSLARGYRPYLGGVDKVRALDTTTWFIAAVLPENLQSEYGISPFKLMRAAETHFWVESVCGYDYTDAGEAARAGRHRLSSIEWSGEMALVYGLAAQGPYTLAAQKQKDNGKRAQILKGIDRFEQKYGDKSCYPYATEENVLTFANGWRTPKARSDGKLAGSVAGTSWRLFAEGWNPLRLEQKMPWKTPTLSHILFVEAAPKEKQKAVFLPSALTSEGLTTAAWINFNAGHKKEARQYALRCVHLYSRTAQEQQAKKAADGGLIRSDSLNEQLKQRIFSYAALNDVAACWFILAKLDPALTPQAADIVRRHFSLAQVWDPAGKFWTVADNFPH